MAENKWINPLNSRLDADQTTIRAYDEDKNRHRVDAEVSAVISSVDVIIDAASGDNIAIQDSEGDELQVNGDGSINVIVQDITLQHENDSVEVFQANHDNLNANANVQQNNTDVSLSNPLYTQTTNGSLETTQQSVLTQLQNANTSLDNIESDADAIRIATQSIDSDIDVQLSTRASEATQLLVRAELQTANTSLDNIEADAEAIRLQTIDINSELDAQTILLNSIDQSTNDIETATESLNTKIDVNLSTRNAESTQQLVLTELQSANTSLDNIEADAESIRVETVAINVELDAQTLLLTQIRDNADTVETLLSNILTNTNDLETLGATTNSLLTQIRDYVDTVETLITSTNTKLDTSNVQLTAINANTDGLEGLVTSSNGLLTQIRDYVDTVETLITASNVQLSAINSNTDGLESLITTSNSLLTAIGNNTDTLETLIASTNTKLDTVISTLSTINGKIANDYGASTGAIRTASQIGNTTGAANFNAGVTGAQTLRTSSNITRNGTELSYNNGASDANTLRTASNLNTAGTPLTSTLVSGKQSLDSNITQQVMMSDRSSSGSIAANGQEVIISTVGASTAIVEFSGTWVGTIGFQGTSDLVGTPTPTWSNIIGMQSYGALIGSTSINQQVIFPVGGWSQIRMVSTAWTSGTSTIEYNVAAGTQASAVYQFEPTALNGTMRLKDGSGNNITSTTNSAKQRLDVNTIITNSAGTFTSDVAPYNRLRVTTEPSTLMADKFDGSSLDSNIWTQQNAGGATIGIGTGNLSLNTSGTSQRAMISTIPTFQHPGNAFLQFGAAMKFETALFQNTKRQWGFITGGAFTYANPFTDGVMWEVTETAELRASIYNTSVRTFSTVVTAPTDGNFHRYDIFYNTQNISWYIDGVLQAQTTVGFNPVTQTLPGRIAMLNNTAVAPAGTPILQCQAIAFTDTAHNNNTISDGTYGFRKLKINELGAAAVTGVGLTPASPAANTVGVTSASALAANALRKGLIIRNISVATISLGLGVAAVLNSGITLLPGDVWNMDSYDFTTGQIFAIASLAGSNLSIQEFS